jgi:hypothetical protein
MRETCFALEVTNRTESAGWDGMIRNNRKGKAGILTNAKYMEVVRALKLNDNAKAISHRN